MDYDSLRESILSDTSNDDPEFQAQVDGFIRKAESLVKDYVRLPKFSANINLSTVANQSTVEAPEDFLSVDNIFLPGYGSLEQKEPDFIDEAYSDPGEVGTPRYFAMNDDREIRLGPTPDAVYSMPMKYFSVPASIVDQKDETYIASRYPAALEHGTLMFAALYMKDMDSFAAHQSLFVNSLGLASEFAKGRATKQSFEKASSAIESGELR